MSDNSSDRGESPLISTSLSLTSKQISKQHTRVNHQIKSPQVRVVDENQGLVGVMPTYEALRIAQERSVDLVEIAPTANPPVCKLMDFGAFKYRQEKTERKQRLKQKKVEVKGVRISLKIGQHDLDHRVNLSRKFLEQGDKVRLEMILRGRELQHQDLARQKITDFIAAVGNAAIEAPLSRMGNRFIVLITNNNAKTENA